MKLIILITSVLSFVSSNSAQTENCSLSKAVKFEVIAQRKMPHAVHNIWATREIEFRLTNTSNFVIYIRGDDLMKFYPKGFIVRFNNQKRHWITPNGNDEIPKFKELEIPEFDNFMLNPNQSLNFTNLLEDFTETINSARKVKYKQIIYGSFDKSDDETQSLESPIFRLIKLK